MVEFLPDMICTEPDMIAETVLLPGDPLRAKYIAEHFLERPVLYNTVRGLYGYTGWYRGSKVSVQSTGMGTTCIMECAYQLIEKYGCKNLIRIGTSGSDNPDIHVGDTICSLASSNLKLRGGGFWTSSRGQVSWGLSASAAAQLKRSLWTRGRTPSG